MMLYCNGRERLIASTRTTELIGRESVHLNYCQRWCDSTRNQKENCVCRQPSFVSSVFSGSIRYPLTQLSSNIFYRSNVMVGVDVTLSHTTDNNYVTSLHAYVQM